jgi:hypothetical protein
MNHLDHFLRRQVLKGSTTVTLTTGTAEDLYPLSNVYNGRPGVPFRSTDINLIIDIDFQVAKNIADVSLLATNIHNIGGTSIILKAGNAFPPVTYNQSASNFGNPEFQESDYYGYVSLFPYQWIVGASYRYWRLDLTFANMQSPYAQIGEIYFNDAGDYSWWDEPDKLRTGYNWPLRSDPVLDHERDSETRMMRLAATTEFRNATKDQLASELESKYRTQELARIFPFSEKQITRSYPPYALQDAPWYFGQSPALGIRQTFTDKWDGNFTGDSILQTFDGDGKI